MQFDPAIAAQASFTRAQNSGELGADLERAREAEAIFSASAGREATAAYYTLLDLGGRHPDTIAFQEFLIYITWQQVTEETIPAHFQKGAALCDKYLSRSLSPFLRPLAIPLILHYTAPAFLASDQLHLRYMQDQSLEDRLYRADSWIQAAAGLRPEQLHEAFIFLYIAFNCLYGRRQYEGDETQIGKDLAEFFKKLRVMHERDIETSGAILKQAITAARRDGAVLIRDKFLSNRYWRGGDSSVSLQKQLIRDASMVEEQLALGSYDTFLDLTFRRISVLRNQIMHGCATYGPRSYGQASLAKGLRFLRVMVPAFYELIKRYGHEVKWDPVPYPRSGSKQHPRA